MTVRNLKQCDVHFLFSFWPISKKEEAFNSDVFLCLYPQYSEVFQPIFNITFVFEQVYYQLGPIGIKYSSDDEMIVIK